MNHDRDTHDNAARLVIEILRVSREVSESAQIHERCEDPILNTLESPETVELVLRIVFGRNSVSDILNFYFKIGIFKKIREIDLFDFTSFRGL